MKELILHIGYPKSGSSALQTTFAASRDGLRRHGIFYPDAPGGLHNALTAQFHPEPETLWPYNELPGQAERRAAMRRDFAALERRLGRQGERRVVLSSESLIALTPEGVARLCDWARGWSARVRAICYVRHPVPYASSLIQERVKQGQTLAEVADLVPTGRIREVLPVWSEAFGRERVVVRPLDPAQLAGGEVVADFAALIGYSGALDRSQQYGNPSLSHAATLLLSAAHALAEPARSRATGLDWVRQVPGTPFRLPGEWVERVRAAARPELAYLERDWGVRLPEPVAGGEAEPFGADTLDFIVRRLTG